MFLGSSVDLGAGASSDVGGSWPAPPTSVALDPRFIAALKKEAQARGIPYQILMRMFIIEGFERMKKTG